MSACGSEPHSSAAEWQYMHKIEASFGERKNGIQTQDLLNTSQTPLATAEPTTGLSTEELKQVCI